MQKVNPCAQANEISVDKAHKHDNLRLNVMYSVFNKRMCDTRT